jgi:hypothetical protein
MNKNWYMNGVEALGKQQRDMEKIPADHFIVLEECFLGIGKLEFDLAEKYCLLHILKKKLAKKIKILQKQYFGIPELATD